MVPSVAGSASCASEEERGKDAGSDLSRRLFVGLSVLQAPPPQELWSRRCRCSSSSSSSGGGSAARERRSVLVLRASNRRRSSSDSDSDSPLHHRPPFHLTTQPPMTTTPSPRLFVSRRQCVNTCHA